MPYDYPALDESRFAGLARTRIVIRHGVPCREPDPAEYVQLAHWSATAFRRRYPHFDRDVDEVHAEAMVGLLKGCLKFDPSRGYKFVTYGSHAVYRHLWKVLVETPQHPKRLPRRALVSLETPIGRADGKGEPGTLAEFVPDPEDWVDELDTADAQWSVLRPLLGRLSARYREVIELRFWYGLTLVEVGRRLGVCRERIRQIEDAALLKMGKAGTPRVRVKGKVRTTSYETAAG